MICSGSLAKIRSDNSMATYDYVVLLVYGYFLSFTCAFITSFSFFVSGSSMAFSYPMSSGTDEKEKKLTPSNVFAWLLLKFISSTIINLVHAG